MNPTVCRGGRNSARAAYRPAPRHRRSPCHRRRGRSGRLGPMASLADATPPIALGAFDGRYRGVIAPLVDHLSEPALNRERIRVEIEWLIWLTTHQVVPGVRALNESEQSQLRQVVDDFGADE